MTRDCSCSCSSNRRRRGVSFVLTAVLLFTALGGTAVAAGSLARNSVGSAQIKKDAVTAAKLRAGSVGASELQRGSVGGATVVDSSLTGADLANGSVTGDDLADASIGGRKIAANSVGLQAVERSTQDYFTNVPTTQVAPATASDLGLTVNAQNVVRWVVTPGQVGLNLVQSQVSIRTSRSVTVSCEIAVDDVVATRVRQTIATTDSIADYATVPLTTTVRVAKDSVVSTRCDAGRAFAASAVTADSVENRTSRSTVMTVTRLAR